MPKTNSDLYLFSVCPSLLIQRENIHFEENLRKLKIRGIRNIAVKSKVTRRKKGNKERKRKKNRQTKRKMSQRVSER